MKTDWEAWAARDLGGADIVRFARSLGRIAFAGSLLDGTVVKARIDKKATAIPILVAIGVRRDGQKVLIGLKNMGGETTAAWRAFLEDLSARGLREPDFLVVDGAPGLEAALAELWPDAPVQRCTVHSEGGNATGPNDRPNRNLLAHAPKRLHDELTEEWRWDRRAGGAAKAHRNATWSTPRPLRRSNAGARRRLAQMAAEVPRRRRQPRG